MSSTSAPTTTQQPKTCAIIAATVMSSTISAGLGYLGARILTSINPIAGLIYGAASGITRPLAHIVATKCAPESPFVKAMIRVIGYLASIKLGAIIATAAGYPLTFGSAFILNIASAGILIGGSICILTLPFIVIIACKACKDRTGFIEAGKNILQSAKDLIDYVASGLQNNSLPTAQS